MIALYVHPKNSNHLRSHLRAIMALDHSRLGLEDKIRPNFFRSTCVLYKILPTSLGTCKPTFYTFYTSHLRWNSTVRWCFYHTDLGAVCSISQFCKTNCTHSIYRMIEARVGFKKNPKSPIRLARSHFWKAPCRLLKLRLISYTLQHNKEFIMFIFYLMVL